MNRRKPTEEQSRALRRIAQSGCMMVTHSERGSYYTDANGGSIKDAVAKALIKNGWVDPQRDSMYDFTPQTWRVRTP